MDVESWERLQQDVYNQQAQQRLQVWYQEFQQYMQDPRNQQQIQAYWQQYLANQQVPYTNAQALQQIHLQFEQDLWQQYQNQRNPQATQYNPTASGVNCVHAVCAYILNTTAAQIAAQTGVPEAVAGTTGLPNNQVNSILQRCGLVKPVKQFNDADTLFGVLQEWVDGVVENRHGTYICRYDRSTTAHLVVLLVTADGWAFVDPQVPQANTDDIQGLVATGAQFWEIMGPY